MKYTLKNSMALYYEELKGIKFNSPIGSINNGYVLIREGFKWDGCTPKIRVLGLWFGTPDGAWNWKRFRYLKNWSKSASLIHDFLYIAHHRYGLNISRGLADKCFYVQMKRDNFPGAKLYHWAVKKFGNPYWQQENKH